MRFSAWPCCKDYKETRVFLDFTHSERVSVRVRGSILPAKCSHLFQCNLYIFSSINLLFLTFTVASFHSLVSLDIHSHLTEPLTDVPLEDHYLEDEDLSPCDSSR